MGKNQKDSEYGNQRLIIICANCHAVKIFNKWIPFRFAHKIFNLKKARSKMRLSHGVCKSCAYKLYGPAAERAFELSKQPDLFHGKEWKDNAN